MKGVTLTELKRIDNPKGDIYHALKGSESSFLSFGEAYFTNINFEEIKGWKKHTKMRLNIVVPVGSVSFYIHDDKLNVTKEFKIDESNYCRLTIEPGLWVAFKGKQNGVNLILNIASIEHDPDESVNLPLESIPVKSS